ncbi:DnaJ domain-containing protein [Planktothrix sp.]|uniref:J domain-containing protein n=1 Tax=Planktothrix sp. TaxID=3088171 RepID=UPI0038D4FC24
MDTKDYYRQLGLRFGASLEAVKASYRKLARQYHPDVNPGNEVAREKFMAITEAYKVLLTIAKPEAELEPVTVSTKTGGLESGVSHHQAPKVKITAKSPPIQFNPELTPEEQKIKANSYLELQNLLKYKRFPRAIALIEGLAQRIPHDPEIRQWQAISYQRWGRQLIAEKQVEKARNYLKKALKTDPHNRALWAEVERDFRQLEKIY